MAAEKTQSKTRSKAAGTKSAEDAAPGTPPSFEEALEALESLVAEMEGDDLPLENMIVGYEEGVRLRSICEKRLEEAQAKVELIRDRGAAGGGDVSLEDFDPAGANAAAGSSGSSSPQKSSADPADEKGGSDGELF